MTHLKLHPKLPIFAVNNGPECAIYIPGYVMPATRKLLKTLSQLWNGDSQGSANTLHVADVLETAADEKLCRWESLKSIDYKPICLNVQFPYICNLKCRYCYARPETATSHAIAGIDRDAVIVAANTVVENCLEKNAPFQLILQGMGEPTLNWTDLCWCVRAVRDLTKNAGIACFAHLSTNGQFDREKAVRIAEFFDHVTVSCDGPPAIQNSVRPRKDDNLSSDILESSVELLSGEDVVLENRVTISPTNARKLDKVITYIVNKLKIDNLRLELVYEQPQGLKNMPDPRLLANSCHRAVELAGKMGADLRFTGIRLTDLHGAYCDIPRQVLRVGADGKAINCLLGGEAQQCKKFTALLQESSSRPSLFSPDTIEKAVSKAYHIPARCKDCVNIFHCARNCPVECPGTEEEDSPLYRCRFHQKLAENFILKSIRQTDDKIPPTKLINPSFNDALGKIVENLPEKVDREKIMRQTLTASRYYDVCQHNMPKPSWKESKRCLKKKDSDPFLLCKESLQSTSAISVYVHLPFCNQRCLFCDCHSVVAKRNKNQKYARYVDRLLKDLEFWCVYSNINKRYVSTVHFGGGTPDAVGYPLLKTVVNALSNSLCVDADTEWAIETTSQGAGPEGINHLISLGFNRLHVGVQTFNDNLRRKLGRISPAEQVSENLVHAMSMGMVSSIDMLYGLPGQSVASLLADIECLARLGVHGVSLYRLNLSSRNRKLVQQFPEFTPDPLKDCIALQVAEHELLKRGYQRNHHVHYARLQDRNKYFRHAVRGEDLLAIGASAAGKFGEREYVSECYPSYIQSSRPAPPMEAIATPSFLSKSARRLAVLLMCGEAHLPKNDERYLKPLFQRWLDAGLLLPQNHNYGLSALGAWLLPGMLDELESNAG